MEDVRNLVALILSLRPKRKDVIDSITILIALKYHEPLGRIKLSSMLGLGEKRTRNLLITLRNLGLIEQNKGGAWLTSKARELLRPVSVIDKDTTCCSIRVDKSTIADALNKLIRIRDILTINLEDSSHITLLGAILDNNVLLPGVPRELAVEYRRDLDKCHTADSSFFAIFNKPHCFHCCSALIHALTTASKLGA